MIQDIKYTKTKNRLYTAGQGILLFTIWDIIQGIMTVLTEGHEILNGIGFYDYGQFEQAIIVVLTLLLLLIIAACHLFVGFKAMKLSDNPKRSLFFLVIDILMLLASIGMIMFMEIEITAFDSQTIKSIAELVINITECVILLEIVIYSIQFKSYSKGAK